MSLDFPFYTTSHKPTFGQSQQCLVEDIVEINHPDVAQSQSRPQPRAFDSALLSRSPQLH